MPSLSRMAESVGAAPLRAVRLGAPDALIERKADGTILMRTAAPLGAYHGKLSEPLVRWAREAPERVFLAERSGDDGDDGVRISHVHSEGMPS